MPKPMDHVDLTAANPQPGRARRVEFHLEAIDKAVIRGTERMSERWKFGASDDLTIIRHGTSILRQGRLEFTVQLRALFDAPLTGVATSSPAAQPAPNLRRPSNPHHRLWTADLAQFVELEVSGSLGGTPLTMQLTPTSSPQLWLISLEADGVPAVAGYIEIELPNVTLASNAVASHALALAS